MNEIKDFKTFMNESAKFKDLNPGDKFLRFGENGQLWKKTSDVQAEFIKNVGFKTAKYHKKPGTFDIFPATMDVTPITEDVNNKVTLNVTIKNLDESTAADFIKVFAFMKACGNAGMSRSLHAFLDGDGHFRPDIKVEGYDLSQIDYSKNWNSVEDTISLDFGA